MEDSNSNHQTIKPQNSEHQQFRQYSDEQFAATHNPSVDQSQPDNNSIKPELEITPQNKTLGTVASDDTSDSDLRFNSPQHLSEVPVKYALSPLEALVAIKDHVFQNHQKTLDNIPDQAAQVESEGQFQSNNSYLPEISPPSATQSMSSITSTSQQNLSVADNRLHVDVLDKEKKILFKHKSLSIVLVSKKTSHDDGYNWRKYGQKQVKSPEGSRSYYRCTHWDCYAKKIECSDCTNRIIDTVYKSQHNHDPPNKVSCSPKSRLPRSPKSRSPPSLDHSKTANSSTGPSDAVPSTSLITYAEQRSSTSSLKVQSRDGYDEKSEMNVDYEDTNEAEPRKRLKKKRDPNSSQALSKCRKKPKLVVHAAGDVVTSGDGYRWRKYGQKMVKGNPHPRNYYRCTSVGCPVRKYIERAVDDPIAAIITYKGVHDHDMPVPKKRQALPSALIASTAVGAPAPLSSLQVKMCEQLQNEISKTKWSVDKVGEAKSEASKHGHDMEIPSRTLMSVGFEIKPC